MFSLILFRIERPRDRRLERPNDRPTVETDQGSGAALAPTRSGARLRFIKRAQDLGFSLEEIAELLELRVEHGASCAAVETKAKDRIAMVEKKIGELERMKTVLVELSRACDLREPTSDCPILASLSEGP